MTPYYDFFLSFSSIDWRKNQKDDIHVFFADLVARLARLGRGDGGFFAPDDMHRGVDWERELASALARSRVLVPMYSPNYFKSVYCGKEWRVFHDRYDENRRILAPGVQSPEVMLPVVWTADLLRVPDDVAKTQYRQGTDPEKYIDRGLGYLMQSPRRFGAQYQELVDRLGLDLARLAEAQGPARVRQGRQWNEIDPPFPGTYKRGLGFVRYVFIVGRSDEMEPLRQQRDAYGTFENRQDWRPCFPDIDRQAGDLARVVAAEAGKDFEFVEPRDLTARMREANDLNNVLAVVVDPWSVSLPSFDAFTRELDTQNRPASGVIVAWNQKDPETTRQLPILKNNMADRFRGRLKRREYFNDTVSSPESFCDALTATFNAAHERLVEGGKIPSAETGPAQPLPSVKS
jgi:FxsC-like protein